MSRGYKGYQERIRPIGENGIKSVEAQIGYKERKVKRLETFFKSDKSLEVIENLKEEIAKLRERLERRIRVSQ